MLDRKISNALRSLAPDDCPAMVYLARLAPGSRRAMFQALDVIALLLTGGRHTSLTCQWQHLRYQHTQAVRADLVNRYAPATVNKALAALRGVLKECWRLGLMEAGDYQRAVDLASVPGTSLPRGRALRSGELRSLFAVCREDSSAAGRRDAAIIATLVGAGLRRSEAAALVLADYDIESGAITIHAGKGQKARIAYVSNGADRALQAWLAVRGPAAGALFCPITKAGDVVIRQLTAQAIYNALLKRGAAATLARFSPHDLRRTFVSDLLDAGADIATVQKLAGHSTIATTQRYDRRGEQAKRQAVALVHIPYTG